MPSVKGTYEGSKVLLSKPVTAPMHCEVIVTFISEDAREVSDGMSNSLAVAEAVERIKSRRAKMGSIHVPVKELIEYGRER